MGSKSATFGVSCTVVPGFPNFYFMDKDGSPNVPAAVASNFSFSSVCFEC